MLASALLMQMICIRIYNLDRTIHDTPKPACPGIADHSPATNNREWLHDQEKQNGCCCHARAGGKFGCPRTTGATGQQTLSPITMITDAGKPTMEVVVKKGEKIEHYKSTGNIGQGEGRKPGRRTG